MELTREPVTVNYGHPMYSASTRERREPARRRSLLVGVFALLFCWIPFCGMAAIPVAGIHAILAVVGLLVSTTGGALAWDGPAPEAAAMPGAVRPAQKTGPQKV